MSKEIWRDVVGYEGIYEVSNKGRVRNIHTGLIRKPTDNRTGYLQIGLSSQGIQKHFYVHRLVAAAFIDNPDGLPEVNHKDENKLNNEATNLEWCTRQYNVDYSKAIPVMQFKANELVGYFKSSVNAQDITGVAQNNIIACCSGKRATAGGYEWMQDIDSFSTMYELQRRLQTRLGTLTFCTDKARTDFIKEQSIHLTQELHEMLAELPYFKDWKDYTQLGEEDIQEALKRAREEYIDMFHFVLNIGIGLGMTSDEIYMLYMGKNTENHRRQTDGYVHVIKDTK